MTLTEQWKNGELPDGYYYIIVKKEFSNRIDFYNSSATIWSYNSNDVIKQVLAPVPSYQEYLESESHCAVYSEVNKSLKEENQHLKELLRECKLAIFDYPPYDFASDKIRLQIKINQALGEKK